MWVIGRHSVTASLPFSRNLTALSLGKRGWLTFICAEASWVISRPAQGRGIAKEAAVAAHQWFVQTFSPAKTVCLIAKNNPGSVSVAEHVGYHIYDECLYKGAECLKLACLWDKSVGSP
ncbi:GNAT family N-acetyltransferase [Salmonella enterica subsp. diarizonae]|nr:GNAT family N-acetyltransferase [Salmonella enterica subsp. diarizonae]